MKFILVESENKSTYTYSGNIYRFGDFYDKLNKEVSTQAPTLGRAISNIVYKLKDEYGFAPYENLSIDEEEVKMAVTDEERDEAEKEVAAQKAAEKANHYHINDPKYNFYDPDRIDDYEVE